jgi:hypothetical protein
MRQRLARPREQDAVNTPRRVFAWIMRFMRTEARLHRPWLWIALALGTPKPAIAGKWCGGGTSWAPIDRVVPRHPHLVYFIDRLSSGPYIEPHRLLPVKATIDGKPVRVVVSDAVVDRGIFRSIEIMSDRSGRLEVTAGVTLVSSSVGGGSAEPETTVDRRTYTIDPKWGAPSPTAQIRRYHDRRKVMSGSGDFSGATIAVDVPAIEFTARWRRDARADWQTARMSVRNLGGLSATSAARPLRSARPSAAATRYLCRSRFSSAVSTSS